MRPTLSQTAKRPASHPGTYRDNTPRRGIHYRHLRCEQLEARRLLSIGPGPDLPEMSLVDPSTSSSSGLTTSYQLDGDGADSSGGGQAVVIQTVPVGNPGNPNDTRYGTPGYGGVDYAYNIGKYEVTAGQYTEFLNAVAATDPFGLYKTSMWSSGSGCMIERTGSPGSYSYSVATDRANRPVNNVSWGDAARFCNWLHNGQPSGAQDLTTTEDGAYFLIGATTYGELQAVNREADWRWAIPTEDEWYKAAYYDSATSTYYEYPTSSNTAPGYVKDNGYIAGTLTVFADGITDPGNNATYNGDSGAGGIGSPYYRTEAGEWENSGSPYGTFDQGGNVFEWNEAILSSGTGRGSRGGSYSMNVDSLSVSFRSSRFVTDETSTVGFRVASIATIDTADFGDAPSPYPTLLASDGARHLATGPTLGTDRDTDWDGQPTAAADGDDITGTPDDEDGITFLTPTLFASTTSPNTTAGVDIDLQNADASSNRLDAWIDFNQDGDWDDSGEQVFTSYNLGTANGTQTLNFTIPQNVGTNVELGDTFARIRLSTVGGLSPTGLADDGEVEDYKITIFGPNDEPIDVDLTPRSVAENEAVGTVVGSLSTTDPNVGDSHTYSLASGVGSGDNGSFAIDGGQLKTAAGFDFETKSSYTVRIRSTDQGGLWTEEVFTIIVTDTNEPPILDEIGNKPVDEQATLTFTATATDQDLPADGLTFSLDQASLDAGMSITSGGAFSWTPSESQGGSMYLVTITVTDDGAGALTDWETFHITVAEVNLAPVLDEIGNKPVDEEATLSFTATATDQDLPANGLTFSLDAGAPVGANIDPATGLFTWTPTEAQGPGDYDITVRVTDDGVPVLNDFEPITITVNEVNLPPVLSSIGNQEGDEETELTFTATATDPDIPANGLTFSLDVGAPVGASIGESTGVFTWTPTEAQGPGSYPITVRVTDDGVPMLDDFEPITVTIRPTVGWVPYFPSPGQTTINVQAQQKPVKAQTTLNFSSSGYRVSDWGQVTQEGTTFIANARVERWTGIVLWVMTTASHEYDLGILPQGNYLFTFMSYGQLVRSESFVVDEVNLPPVLGPIGDKSVNEEVNLAFTAAATDQDLPAQTLTFSLDAAAVALGMSITAGGEFSWTPTESQGGTSYDATITVADNGTNPANLTDFETISITVAEVNVTPVLDPINNRSVDEEAELAFTATASDQDLPADTLTFSLDTTAEALGMSITTGGEFSWTPSESQGGSMYAVTITVTDDGAGALTDWETFHITVAEVNVAPVLDPIGHQTVDEQATLSFTATATDQDLPADGLTFSLDQASLDAGMSITSGGAFSWTPTELQGGTSYNATITVSDGSLSDSETISITVAEVGPTIVDLGQIDFQLIEHLSLAAGSLYYRLQTTHEAFLTMEVIAPTPPKSARLKLYDANPARTTGLTPLVDSTQDEDGSQRIDWPAAAGTVYYVEVYGDNSDFDVRFANLLSHAGTTVTVHGTEGSDTFEFDAAASRDVTINGVRYHFDAAQVESVTFDGGDGYDMVVLDDSTGDDTLTAEARHAVFSNSGQTPGFTVTVDGFEELQAYARAGGRDTAYLHDSDANDKFKAEPAEDYAKMYGGRMYNRVKFYDVVEAFSSGEKDLARLFDTAGNDTFDGQREVSWLRTNVFDVGVHNFRHVIAYALEDGNDVATLRDSALMDEVYLKSHKSEIVDLETKGEIYEITARGFDTVHADGSQGEGYDRVKVWETPRYNHLEAADNWAWMFVQEGELEMIYDILAFEMVKVRASTGGNDTANVTEPLQFDLLLEDGWGV